MKRDKRHWLFCIFISRQTLLFGIYVFLLELCKCKICGVKWIPNTKISLHGKPPVGMELLLDKPQIHSPPTKLTVRKGDTIYLPCKVHNLGEFQLIWKHKTNVLAGTNVSTFSDTRISFLEDFTLKLSNINNQDEGVYECLVTSWPPLRVSHSVTVQDPPSVSLITPSHLTVTEGETVEIGCVPHGNPVPKIYWTMRDGQMPVEPVHLNKSTLLLERVTRKFSGLYVCTADNGVGRPAIGAVYVRVLHSPEIQIPKRRVHGGVGFKAELISFVYADPKAEVHWRIGQSLVDLNSERIFADSVGMHEHFLTLNSVKASDFATYTVEANNSLGFDIKYIEFVGVPNVPVLSRWEAEDVDGRIQVTLYWAVECYSPLIDYTLQFRPASISADKAKIQDYSAPFTKVTVPADKLVLSTSFFHTKSFTLRGLNASSVYEAVVTARNKYGSSHSSEPCHFSTFLNSSNADGYDATVDDILEQITQTESSQGFPKDRFTNLPSNSDKEKAEFSRALNLLNTRLLLFFTLLVQLINLAESELNYL